jgi:hypothetical protein
MSGRFCNLGRVHLVLALVLALALVALPCRSAPVSAHHRRSK